MADKQPQPETQTQWWSSLPQPRSTPAETSADEVMKAFDDMDIKNEPRPFLLIDVRRNDWEGGTIRTSLNLPAQSFYQSRKSLLDLCDRAGIKRVIFYCGSSQGRGPRCAGWFQDYIDDVGRFGKKSALQVRVLKGGIKGWVKEFEGAIMEGFVEEYWEQFKVEGLCRLDIDDIK